MIKKEIDERAAKLLDWDASDEMVERLTGLSAIEVLMIRAARATPQPEQIREPHSAPNPDVKLAYVGYNRRPLMCKDEEQKGASFLFECCDLIRLPSKAWRERCLATISTFRTTTTSVMRRVLSFSLTLRLVSMPLFRAENTSKIIPS